MKDIMNSRYHLIPILACITSLALSASVHGAELTPYRLPSEGRSYLNLPAQQPATDQQREKEQVREEYYQTFESKVEGLSSLEKSRLMTKFGQKEQTASSEQKYEEAQHYHRLNEILKRSDRR